MDVRSSQPGTVTLQGSLDGVIWEELGEPPVAVTTGSRFLRTQVTPQSTLPHTPAQSWDDYQTPGTSWDRHIHTGRSNEPTAHFTQREFDLWVHGQVDRIAGRANLVTQTLNGLYGEYEVIIEVLEGSGLLRLGNQGLSFMHRIDIRVAERHNSQFFLENATEAFKVDLRRRIREEYAEFDPSSPRYVPRMRTTVSTAMDSAQVNVDFPSGTTTDFMMEYEAEFASSLDRFVGQQMTQTTVAEIQATAAQVEARMRNAVQWNPSTSRASIRAGDLVGGGFTASHIHAGTIRANPIQPGMPVGRDANGRISGYDMISTEGMYGYITRQPAGLASDQVRVMTQGEMYVDESTYLNTPLHMRKWLRPAPKPPEPEPPRQLDLFD